MIYKKRILLFLFLILNILLLFSCKNDIKIKQLYLTIDNEQKSYILNGSVKEINISASFDNTDYYDDKKIQWSLFEDAKIQNKTVIGNDISNKIDIKNNKNILINFFSLNKLSSYVVSAECDGIISYKTFNLTSEKKLSENTVFSFIKIDDNLIIDEKTGEILSLDYYNSYGKKIENENDKEQIRENSTLSYIATKNNSILIEVKNYLSFGLLSLKSKNENVEIYANDNHSFFVTLKKFNQQGYLNSSLENIPFTLYAGDEQSLNFNITFLNFNTSSLPNCNITSLIEDEKVGFYTDITGDKVSTDYKKIQDGNTIEISVYRSPFIKNVFDETFKKISLTKSLLTEWKTTKDIAYISDIDYGYRVYFPYAGTYKIVATIKSNSGYKESEKIVSVPYYSTKDMVNVEYFYLEMKNWSYDNEEIFKTTIYGDDYSFSKEDRFKITIDIKDNITFRYNINYISYDNSFKSQDYTRINQVVKDKISYTYKGQGLYSSIYVIAEDIKGFGNVLIDEDMFKKDGTLIIDNIFSLNPIEISRIKEPNIKGRIEIDEKGYKYTFTLEDSSNYFSNKRLFARFYEINTAKTDGFISDDFKENKDTEIKKDKDYIVHLPISTANLNDYKLMCFIYSPTTLSYNSDVFILPRSYSNNFNVNTEKVEIINCPDEILNSADINVYDNILNFQDKENKRKFEIRNIKDESGNFKLLKYKFNDGVLKTLGNDEKYFIYSEKITTEEQTLFVYAYNQNLSHCEVSEEKFKLEKLQNNPIYYAENCWRGSWTGAGYFWPSITHYQNTDYLKFPYYIVSYTTRGYIGTVLKQIVSPSSCVIFYSSAGRCYASARQHYMASSYLMKYGYISSDVIEVPCNGDAWFGSYENCL